MNGTQTVIDVVWVPVICRIARANDMGGIGGSGGTQQSQCLKELEVVLVLPKLIADEDKLVWEMKRALNL